MATNPVSAFLHGFNAVNTLEANRQNREIREEQRSRMHLIWSRRDQEYERLELKRIQQGRRERYEAISLDLFDSIKSDGAKIKEEMLARGVPEAEVLQRVEEFFNSWYDGTGEERRFNIEVMNTVQTEDPSAREHFALAHGRDAAAGSLVNSNDPIANLGMFPMAFSPETDERPSFFIEVNTPDGVKPFTNERTAAENDNVAITPINMQGMVGYFGAEFMSARTPALFRWREMLIEQQGGRTGDPRNEVVATQQQEPSTQSQPDDDTAEFSQRQAFDETIAKNKEFFDQQEAAGGGDREGTTAGGSGSGGSDIGIGSGGEITRREGSGGTNIEFLGQSNYGEEADEPGLKAALGRTAGAVGDTAGTAASAAGETIVKGAKLSKAAITQGVKSFIEHTNNLGDSINSLFGIESDLNNPTNKKELSKVVDNPDVFDRNAVVDDPDAALDAAKGSEPNKEAAKTLLNASGSRRRIPYPHELYFAAGFVDAGLISQQQFAQFANTGSFDIVAQEDLKFITSDGFTTGLNKKSGQIVSRVQTGNTGPKPQTEAQRFSSLQTFAKNKFLDRDGKVDLRALERFSTDFDVATTLLGLSRPEITRNLVNRMATGANFVNYFSPDSSQAWDFNPFDDPKLTANMLALGFLAVREAGIASQPAADKFLFDYGITYRNAFPHARAEALVADVRRIEAGVNDILSRAYNNELLKGEEHYAGLDKDDLRTQVVKDLIFKLGK